MSILIKSTLLSLFFNKITNWKTFAWTFMFIKFFKFYFRTRAWIKPHSTLRRVVFPAPFRPSEPRHSQRRSSNDTSSNTQNSSLLREFLMIDHERSQKPRLSPRNEGIFLNSYKISSIFLCSKQVLRNRMVCSMKIKVYWLLRIFGTDRQIL